ncbi:MAG: glycosyltransferase [Victivallaceae bacterium]|nr:glycosyltransferase [Victivallaceae bacterium]
MEISVIIPCFNAGCALQKCARSLVFAAIPGKTQLIFVDDASTDGSIEKLSAMTCENLTILRHRSRRGVAASRNTGLAAATGKFIAFCDADDFVERDFLQKLVEKIKQDSADAAICAFSRENGNTLIPLKIAPASTGREFIARQMPSMEFNSCCNKLYRKEIIDTHSISFDETSVTAEDLLFNARYFLAARKITVVDETLYHYVGNPFSATAKETKEKAKSSVAAALEIASMLTNDRDLDCARQRLLVDALMTTLRADGFSVSETRDLLKRLPDGFWRDARFGALKQSVLHLAAYAPRLARFLVRCRKN